ncbi:M61 family metallopeptidase [Thalassotalea fusca]
MTLSYQISPSNPASHLFSVALDFPTTAGQSYTLSLPAWLPGSYMIRDFAKHIHQIAGKDNHDNTLELTRLDKQTWQLTASGDSVSISYQVFAFDLSVRTAYLDNQRGFFNGSSTFLCVEEFKDHPCTVTIHAPQAISTIANAKQWRVATGLTRAQGTDKYAFGEYLAENYAELIDGPVAIGDFDAFEFEVEGVMHHMVFTSEHYGDRERMARDVSKLCQHHINLFGEAPFKEYWFITHLLANGFGGLEHKNSTILQASRFDLPNPNKPEELTEDYRTFLSLCSHEYFHAWNVCRIKPKEFVPYDLQKESYTEQLWAYEGITSYYDDFSLYRAGIISFDDYLKILSKTATRVYRGKGELKQSVTESSFYAWTKFYQQGPDAANNIVSYYTKGSLIALWLDLTIRQRSNQQYSLDTLMRELWIHFGRPNIGTSTEDFINITNVLCNADLTKEITSLLTLPERVDLASLLEDFGIEFKQQKFKLLNAPETNDVSEYRPYLGLQFKDQPNGLKITQVFEDSPAAQAGIAVNDILVAIDNLKITEKSIQSLAEHLPANKKVSCHFFRDDQLIQSEVYFTDSPTAGVALVCKDIALAENWQQIIG